MSTKPTTIYLVVLNDEPVEIQSAWSTRELAEQEITRQLNAADTHTYYWLTVRLDVVELSVDTVRT